MNLKVIDCCEICAKKIALLENIYVNVQIENYLNRRVM